VKVRLDHVSHFFVCFTITAICTPFLGVWAWTVGFAVGVGKEVYDIKKTGFDWTDILADVVGIVAAMGVFGLTAIGG
jgi:hypothetical protein